jgi:TP53 regulating kinase and related kinases
MHNYTMERRKTNPNIQLISQGAEAKIFLDEKNNLVIKDRVSKSYRIQELDKKIIKSRTKAETKLLIKANQIINAPLPKESKEINQIIMPFIDGKKLSTYLNNFPLEEQKEIMKKIGESISKLHKADIIHGDLTTSNMILVNYKDENVINDNSQINNHNVNLSNINGKSKLTNKRTKDKNFQIFLIDFGLGYISRKIEDKAVDIHLLKQALEARHFQNWEVLFQEFQKSYSEDYPEAKIIFERLAAVEHRGRYRH